MSTERAARIRELAMTTTDPVEIQARAIAKARGETYDPKRHGPFETLAVPRKERKEPGIEIIGAKMEELMARFEARGKAPNRYLKAVPNDRDDVRKVANQ